MATILALVQSYCREYGLPVPVALQGGDAGALQYREAMNSVGEDLWGRTNWQRCQRRSTWTSTAGTDQGAVTTLFPDDFAHVVPNTFWDYTANFRIRGPVNEVDWQIGESLAAQGPLYYYRVANGRLEVTSTMPAGDSLSLIYKSRRWVQAADLTMKLQFTLDDDTCIFPDRVMKAGLRAYWLRIKQMPHALEWKLYDDMAAAEAAGDTARPLLRMDDNEHAVRPGILIPSGNWIQP